MTIDKFSPIGVTDSGIGGLTVASQINDFLPNEEIIYYGDTKNVPYGNRSREEIISLSIDDIQFLVDNGVKAVVIACNTISSVVDELRAHFSGLPIISIVEAGAMEVYSRGIDNIIVASTVFTAKSQSYKKEIEKLNPNCSVTAVGLPNLARLVEHWADEDEIKREISDNLDVYLKGKSGNLLLGCTHYPIVQKQFEELYPNVIIINPASAQINALKELLSANGLLNPLPLGGMNLNFSAKVNSNLITIACNSNHIN